MSPDWVKPGRNPQACHRPLAQPATSLLADRRLPRLGPVAFLVGSECVVARAQVPGE